MKQNFLLIGLLDSTMVLEQDEKSALTWDSAHIDGVLVFQLLALDKINDKFLLHSNLQLVSYYVLDLDLVFSQTTTMSSTHYY